MGTFNKEKALLLINRHLLLILLNYREISLTPLLAWLLRMSHNGFCVRLSHVSRNKIILIVFV